MAAYAYTAIDTTGRRIKGVVEAACLEAADRALDRDGLTVLRLQAAAVGQKRSSAGRLTTAAIAEFLTDMGTLVGGGMGVKPALEALARQEGGSSIQAVATALQHEVAAGRPLHQALIEHLGPRAGVAPALVAAAEASGDLADGLRRAGEDLQQRIASREAIASAVSYPAFVTIAGLVCLVIILVFVVPSLAPLAGQSGEPTPPALAIMMQVSALLTHHAPFKLGVAAAVLAALVTAGKLGMLTRPAARWTLDSPLGRVVRPFIFGRYAKVLGSLVDARVPIVSALALAAEAAENPVAQERLAVCAAAVREGRPLSAALGGCPGMPGSIVRMAYVGEQSGALGSMLQRAGEMEQTRSIRQINRFAKWVGPMLIVLLGLVVGLLMAGLLASVSSLGDTALN
jgi:general secretion pathway protein F